MIAAAPIAERRRTATHPRELHRRSLTGVGWMSAAQAVGLVLRLGSNLILARLLAPEVYGIIGPAMAALMTLEWFSDLGIRPALIRDPHGDSTNVLRTGWWMGLARAAVLASIAALLSVPLAGLYHQPTLAPVLATLAALPVLQALRSPGQPVLRRTMKYRAVALDEIGQTVVGVAATLLTASVHPSVWAVVAGTLAGAAAGVVISYVQCPMFPAWRWDPAAAQRLLRVSRQVVLNTFLMAVLLNSDRLLGLSLIPLEQMGLYAVAWNLASVADVLLSRACDVYYSSLTRCSDNAHREAFHEQTCRKVAMVVMPCLALGVGLAPGIVRTLYDVRYAGAAIPFALLLARLIPRCLGQLQFQYLLARGEIRVASAAYAVAILAQAALLIPLTQPWGATGLALAGLASLTVQMCVQSAILRVRSEIRTFPVAAALAWMFAGLVLLLFTA